ncbi:MAG: hypothetical protein NZO58_11475, partial [Gemmataceae bacterium]|nr:hypothetical protein [Gemmataceae bacterium]
LLRTVPAAALALAMALGLAALGRVPWSWLLRRLGGASLLMLFFLVWLPLVPDPDGPSYDVAGLQLSVRGVERLVNVLCKTLAVVTV